MLKKALFAAALTMVSGLALAHDYHGRHYSPPVRYYHPPVRYYYAPAPRVIYRPVPVYPVAPVVVPAPHAIVAAPIAPGIVVRLRFPL